MVDPARTAAAARRGLSARKAALTALALALALASQAPGCTDTSTIFSGRWESQDAPLDGLLHGVPVLALGHYGREVAGVAYFMASAATGTLFDTACPCAFVEYNTLNVDRGTLVFETQCDASAPLVRWSLTLTADAATGDPVLEGTVARSDGQEGPVEQVRLQRVREGLTDAERQCPPE